MRTVFLVFAATLIACGEASESDFATSRLVADGQCGEVAGTFTDSPPLVGDRCEVGTPTTVSGTASGWTWKCKGVDGGLTVSCSVRRVPQLGVNLSGAEFGSGFIYGTNYIYPTPQEYDYFIIQKKMKIIRLPFKWERLQRSLYAPLDSDEIGRIDNAVYQVTSRGASIILDMHNYARYAGQVVGSATFPNAAFADVWAKIATRYKDNPGVKFDLMNEPHGIMTEQWRDAAQAAINAIRNAGSTFQTILVEGVSFSSANRWTAEGVYGTSNGTAMLTLNDPAQNMVFSPHQYADADTSGTSDICKSATIYSIRLSTFTAWARGNRVKAFLGEWGNGANPTCISAQVDLLKHLQANPDVWVGATYFAAGPWWGNWFMSLEPDFTQSPSVDNPQMDSMEPYIGAKP